MEDFGGEAYSGWLLWIVLIEGNPAKHTRKWSLSRIVELLRSISTPEVNTNAEERGSAPQAEDATLPNGLIRPKDGGRPHEQILLRSGTGTATFRRLLGDGLQVRQQS